MPKISVITPTVRKNRLGLIENSLDKQSFQDFEWVVSTVTEKPKDFAWAFNRAMNDAIRRSKGDLLISIQDSIWFPSDALQKFHFYFQQNPTHCISGVGDQYKELDENGKPANKVWIDPRKREDTTSLYECNPEDWELNYCSLPKKFIYDIGGFDEEMDKYYGMDNVAIAYRLDMIGAKFFLDQTNESYTLRHDRNKDWDKKHWMNKGFWEWLRNRPPKLDYLSSK